MALAGGGSNPLSHPIYKKQRITVELILWIIAVVLVVWGIVTLFRGALAVGILLIIAGLLVGPGGVSIFSTVPI